MNGCQSNTTQSKSRTLQVNQGSLYPALVKLQQQGWIAAEWGASEKNRKAKYYSLTVAGEKQLAAETENWKRLSGAVGRLLKAQPGEAVG